MQFLSARYFRLLAALCMAALACSGCYDLESMTSRLGATSPAPAGEALADDAGTTAADDAGTSPAAPDDGDGSAATPDDASPAEPEEAAQPVEQPAPDDGTADAADPADDPEPAPSAPSDPAPSAPANPGSGGSGTASNNAHGAGATGPGAESCTSKGTQAGSSSGIASGQTTLLRPGTYGSLKVPSGATVKPYDCGAVTINGTVSLADGATLAGVTVRSDAQYVMKIGGHDITVRNSTIQGGSVEAVRIHDGAKNVSLVGNNLDGGRNNHVVKVKSENGSSHPDGILIDNNVFSKRYYATSSEDLLQLEGHRHVTITNNTFANNARGEDGVDVKQGTDGMVLRGNRFVGGDINAECLLVQGGYANNIVVDNVFEDCGGVSLGAHPELRSMPWWRFEDNTLTNSQLRIRRSDKAEIVDNDMRGGLLKLGISSDAEDTPRNLRIQGTTFDGVKIDNNIRYSYSCVGSVLINVSGDNLSCSG